jgi:outer membrane lipoprotein-sorting protein
MINKEIKCATIGGVRKCKNFDIDIENSEFIISNIGDKRIAMVEFKIRRPQVDTFNFNPKFDKIEIILNDGDEVTLYNPVFKYYYSSGLHMSDLNGIVIRYYSIYFHNQTYKLCERLCIEEFINGNNDIDMDKFDLHIDSLRSNNELDNRYTNSLLEDMNKNIEKLLYIFTKIKKINK